MTPTLVVPPRPYPEQTPVHDAWRRRGGRVHRVSRLDEPLDVPREQVRLYGDYAFCVLVAGALALELVSPPDDLLLTPGSEWLQREVSGSTLEMLLQADFPLFVKPLAPKLFPAVVYPSRKALARDTRGLIGSTPVLVTEPVQWECEVRCLVLEGRVLSCSVYEGEGSPGEARQFARTFAEHHDVACTYVLDVGRVRGRGWGVLEANPVWGAGLNGCDPDAMADCVAAATCAPA